MLGLGAGIDYSLLIIGRYREQVGGGRHAARRVREGGRDLGRVRRRRRADRDGGDRGPARDRHPADRQARHRGRDRRRRRRRVGADDPADHDGRAAKRWLQAAQARPRRSLARVRALGRDRHRAPVAVDRGRRRRAARVRRAGHAAAPRPARRRQPADRPGPSASRTTSSAQAFGPGSNGPFLLAIDTPKGDAATEGQLASCRRRRRHARRGRPSRPRR